MLPKKGIIVNGNTQGNLIIKISIKNNSNTQVKKDDFMKLFNIKSLSDSFIAR